MDALTIQHLVIAVIFIFAVAYMVKRFMPSKNKSGGCNKGCGCSVDKSIK